MSAEVMRGHRSRPNGRRRSHDISIRCKPNDGCGSPRSLEERYSLEQPRSPEARSAAVTATGAEGRRCAMGSGRCTAPVPTMARAGDARSVTVTWGANGDHRDLRLVFSVAG